MIFRAASLSLKRIFLAAWLLAFAASSEAQTVTNVIDLFDTNSYPNGTITNKWSNWLGNAFQSLSLDPSMDANTNAQSGSLKIVANFPGSGSSPSQFLVYNGLNRFSPGLNAIQLTNFQCDVCFAAGSATTGGNYGYLQFGTPVSYHQDYFGGVTVSAGNTNWVHVSIPLNAVADPNLQNITGIVINLYNSSLSGPSTLWVDNIKFTGMATNIGTVTINYTNTQQRIDGFGAASAWMSSMSTSVADLLFSTNTGAGLSLLRTRIAPGGVIDDYEGTIAQLAQARGARVWSTPWSPATSFKTTNSVNGGGFASSTANYQGHAAQLAKYAVTMKNTYGVNLYAVSVQNEPDYDTSYESCVWTGQQIHDFVSYLDAALTASNVASAKIMLPEKSNWSWELATNTLNDTTTSNLVDILACHDYGSSASPVTQFGAPCPKALWETEHYFGSGDDVTNALAVAWEINSFLTVAQVNAYHYWWLTGSGNGSIANNTASPAKRLFAMGNYSRFVRPSFYRVGATNNTAALVTAYKDTNSANFVIVAANPTAYPVNQTFVLTNFPLTGTLTQWVTSASLSLSNQGSVSVVGNTFNYLLPAWTIVSFVFTQPAAPVIVQQPVNQTGAVGGSATFTVTAVGSAPLFYQWFFNGNSNLANQTNSSLTLNGIGLTNVGNYSVIVSNYAGSVTSAVAALTISTSANFVLKADDGFGNSSFNAIGNWTNTSTGAAATFAPTNGYTYATGPYILRTPAGAGNYIFAGDVLVISPGGQLNIKGGSGNLITVTNLMLNGTINNSVNPSSIAAIAGNMIVLGGTLNVSGSTSSDNRVLTNSLTMSGSGALTNFCTNGISYVVYTDDNSAFTGPVIVTNTTLQIASQANLGGNPASFNAAQLLLDNGTLLATASFALNHPNSGVTITPNGGSFNVPSGVTLTVSNPIAGSGGLVKTGGGNLILAGTNAFTGNTTVSNGVLSLVGGADLNSASVSNVPGTTLDVSGLAVPLTVSNQITLGGNLLVNANRTNTSSKLAVSNLFYGGTLIISNSGPAFAAGDDFKFFSASNFSGAFASITPAAPGAGLFWNTANLAVNGVLAVSSLSPTNLSFSVSGGMLALSWPASHLGWTLQTNSVNLANTNFWFAYPGSTALTNVVFPIDPTKANIFYRLSYP